MPIEILKPRAEKLYIPKHKDIETWNENIIFLWGGRFGAKSESVARHLTFKSIKNPHFKCVLARKTFNTIKDSCYEQIKNYVNLCGLSDLFTFKVSPLEINCLSGAKFICRGFDNPEKIKGINEPSDFWIEEAAEITENDFETALTTLRNKHLKPQMYLSFNPETDGDLADNWLYKRFFEGRESYDFTDSFTIYVENIEYKFTIRSVHTTYKDNHHNKPAQIAICENYKTLYETTKSQTSKYYYEVWTLGVFGVRLSERPYLSDFSSLLHVKPIKYNENYPLHISFDKNLNPYLPCSIFQFYDNTFYQIKEFALSHPNNRIKILVKDIIKYLKSINYNSRIYIYGDSTAKLEDTNSEVGINFYSIIEAEFNKHNYRIENNVPGLRTNKVLNIRRKAANPNSQNAADFLNSLLQNNKIIISDTCQKSIFDYSNAPQDKNGGIDKKIKDPKTGGDKFGHFTDILKYFICEFEYDNFVYMFSNKDRFAL